MTQQQEIKARLLAMSDEEYERQRDLALRFFSNRLERAFAMKNDPEVNRDSLIEYTNDLKASLITLTNLYNLVDDEVLSRWDNIHFLLS